MDGDDLKSTVVEPKTRPLLTAGQGEAARRVLGYVAGLPVQRAPARLLGLVLTMRAARSGQANLMGQDLYAMKLPDPHQAVQELAASGWAGAELTGLLEGDPSTVVGVSVPDLGEQDPLALGKLTRTRISGWASRTLVAKLLRKTPFEVKLAGLWLAAHAACDGSGTLDREALTRLTAGGQTGDLPQILTRLLEAGWLAEYTLEGDQHDGYRLGNAAIPYAPIAATTGETVAQRPPGSFSNSQRRAAALELIGPAARYAYWAQDYWRVHGHGPSREVFIHAHWPEAAAVVAEEAVDKLGGIGWLTGVRSPYAIRPGSRFNPPGN